MRAGIPESTLADWHVMDVGTGRQALAFLEMGARRVSHFDISPENVAAVDGHIRDTKSSDRLSTTCCDLVRADLGHSRFDFVYLNGIVQHFSDVGRGLVNCIRALKPGGLLWLYFYRSGSFDQFMVTLLRNLVNGGNVARDDSKARDYDAYSRLFFSENVTRTYLSSAFMDGVFTRYARCYPVSTYLAFAAECGLDLVAASGIEPADREVDHIQARGAGVITLRKTRHVDGPQLALAAKRLSPEKEVNQLSRDLYLGNTEILRTLDLTQQLENIICLAKPHDIILPLVALRLFSFYMQKTKAQGYDGNRRHTDLQALLTGIIETLRDELAGKRRTI